MARMHRRQFLGILAGSAGAAAAAATAPAWAKGLEVTDGPYGPLRAPDPLGLMLPDGFAAREIARYDNPVGPSSYKWHLFPDGGAVFPAEDGGWVYVSNSEAPEGLGGAGAIRFGPRGRIVDAYPILTGTTANCAGGQTPWGTWLSAEEHAQGRVWECDPFGEQDAVPLPALGVFAHEAAAVDPDREQVYLTEDVADGRWYRFTPDAYPDFSSGSLEVARVGAGGAVTWLAVPDPSASATPTRTQVAESTAFLGGEGIWYRDGLVYFVTKLDHRVWVYDAEAETISVLYEPAMVPEPAVLTGPDNLVMSSFGDLLVCEDQSKDQEVVLITPGGEIAPIMRMTGQEGSELTGPAFSPGGDRLYVSSQRGGGGGGITYEVRGPFRRAEPEAPPTSATSPTAPAAATTLAGALRENDERRARERDDGGGGFPVVPVAGAGALAVAVGAAALWRLRTREQQPGAAD